MIECAGYIAVVGYFSFCLRNQFRRLVQLLLRTLITQIVFNINFVMGRSIKEVQQDFARNFGFRDETIWDLLSSKQSDILKKKIKQLIPDREESDKTTKNKKENVKDETEKIDEDAKEQSVKDGEPESDKGKRGEGHKALEALRENLFESVWGQRKYTNGNSLTSIIYVCVTKELDFNKALDSKIFSCHPVFRTRKCIAENNSSECCMIFIDESGRVYKTWDSYINENELSQGTMVAPHNGVYTFDKHDTVILDIYETPASTLRQQAFAVADTASTFGSLASACVGIAALLTAPVSAPIMAGAAIVGTGAAAYTAIRSGFNLIDRNNHEQSVSITNREARSSWFGVVSGTIGIGAMGATRAMSTAAAAGKEISLVSEIAVNGMNISTILISGTGLANGVLDLFLKYEDGESVSGFDVLQLSASLVLFTHSVYNFRLASNIINESRNSTIKNYRDSLSNRQRRAFDKISKETIRIRGGTNGKIDIIRGVNDIPSKQYLNDLFKINKDLNQNNVRPSFGTAGEGIVLNNEVVVDTKVLRGSVQHKVGPNILGQVTQPIPPSHYEAQSVTGAAKSIQSAQILFTNKIEKNTDFLTTDAQNLKYAKILLVTGIVISLKSFGDIIFDRISNYESFKNIVITMANKLKKDVFVYIMYMTRCFLDNFITEIENILKTYISTETVLYQILKHCLTKLKTITLELLQNNMSTIINEVKAYFISLNPTIQDPSLIQKCTTCKGVFSICKL